MPRPNYTLLRGDVVCRYIAWHWRELGYPPSLRAIGKATNISSPSTVQKILIALEREGRLIRDPYKKTVRVANGVNPATCDHDWRITNSDFTATGEAMIECLYCHRRTAVQFQPDWARDLESCPRFMGQAT